jgi:hypothetical protein
VLTSLSLSLSRSLAIYALAYWLVGSSYIEGASLNSTAVHLQAGDLKLGQMLFNSTLAGIRPTFEVASGVCNITLIRRRVTSRWPSRAWYYRRVSSKNYER